MHIPYIYMHIPYIYAYHTYVCISHISAPPLVYVSYMYACVYMDMSRHALSIHLMMDKEDMFLYTYIYTYAYIGDCTLG